MGSQGGIGAAQEFVPPDPGTAPYLRYYTHGGTVFGGSSFGMAILQENGASTGTVTLLARITSDGLGQYAAVPDLVTFYGAITVGGYAYVTSGGKTRRFQ